METVVSERTTDHFLNRRRSYSKRDERLGEIPIGRPSKPEEVAEFVLATT